MSLILPSKKVRAFSNKGRDKSKKVKARYLGFYFFAFITLYS